MELCRICRKDITSGAVPLSFCSEFTSETVSNMVLFVTGVQEDQFGNFPQTICRMCLGSLMVSYELKRTCLESDEYFRGKLLPDKSQLDQFERVDDDMFTVEIEPQSDGDQDLLEHQTIKMEPPATLDQFSESEEPNQQEAGASDDDASFRPPARHRRNRSKLPVLKQCSCGYTTPKTYCYRRHLKTCDLKKKELTNELKQCSCGYETVNACHFRRHVKACDLKKIKLANKLKQCVCGYETFNTFCYRRHLTTCKRKKLVRKGFHQCVCGYNTSRFWCFERHTKTCRIRKEHEEAVATVPFVTVKEEANDY